MNEFFPTYGLKLPHSIWLQKHENHFLFFIFIFFWVCRLLIQKHGMTFVDFWPLESPVSDNTCYTEKRGKNGGITQVRDTLYSCVQEEGTKMGGDVGDVVARWLITLMAYLPSAQ